MEQNVTDPILRKTGSQNLSFGNRFFFVNDLNLFVFKCTETKKHDLYKKEIFEFGAGHQFLNFGFHSDEWWRIYGSEPILG